MEGGFGVIWLSVEVISSIGLDWIASPFFSFLLR